MGSGTGTTVRRQGHRVAILRPSCRDLVVIRLKRRGSLSRHLASLSLASSCICVWTGRADPRRECRVVAVDGNGSSRDCGGSNPGEPGLPCLPCVAPALAGSMRSHVQWRSVASRVVEKLRSALGNLTSVPERVSTYQIEVAAAAMARGAPSAPGRSARRIRRCVRGTSRCPGWRPRRHRPAPVRLRLLAELAALGDALLLLAQRSSSPCRREAAAGASPRP